MMKEISVEDLSFCIPVDASASRGAVLFGEDSPRSLMGGPAQASLSLTSFLDDLKQSHFSQLLRK